MIRLLYETENAWRFDGRDTFDGTRVRELDNGFDVFKRAQ